MYIRRTAIKSRRTGEPYYTYRLVESVRLEGGVRQRTLLNLGRHFDVPRERWGLLAQRIEQLLSQQNTLLTIELDPQSEAAAQRYAALVVRAKARFDEDQAPEEADFQAVDVNSLEFVRPRSVGVEQVGLETLRQLGLSAKLEQLGFNGPQRAAAMGTLIARMAAPGSERATHAWLTEHSGLGELIGYEFATMSPMALYRVSDQ
ncbi:MAG: hypothetical protein ACFCVA_05535 [Gammaproteobacteria bacterium]